MEGVAEVELLLPGGHSPHGGGLAPSALRALSSADLLIWSGPSLETGLARAIRQLPLTNVITLTESSRLKLLPQRAAGTLQLNSDHNHGAQHAHEHGDIDPHLWLSTENARAMVVLLTERVSLIDPENAARYGQNAAGLIKDIEKTRHDIDNALDPIRNLPFMVFHDAYQYFETEYSLHAIASVALDPGRAPGARHLGALRELVRTAGIRCLFTEPQFEPRAVPIIAEDSSIRTGMLDPLGAGLKPGPSHWFELMLGLKSDLLDCLGKAAR